MSRKELITKPQGLLLPLLLPLLLASVGSFTGCPVIIPDGEGEGALEGEISTEGLLEGEGLSEGEGAVDPLDDGSPIALMERQAFDLVNNERVAQGLEPLQSDPDLRAVARAHSEDMVARSFFDHVNPDGLDPFERMDNAGILFTAAAENIAMNGGFADPAATAVDGWMNSPGHRTNILNGVYTHAGLGVAFDSNANAYYFTQNFMKPE